MEVIIIRRRGIFQSAICFVHDSIHIQVLRKSTAGYDLAENLRLTIFFFCERLKIVSEK